MNNDDDDEDQSYHQFTIALLTKINKNKMTLGE